MSDSAATGFVMPIDRRDFLAVSATSLLAGSRLASALDQAQQPMLKPTTRSGFNVSVLTTVGDVIGDYQPPGIPDGSAAFEWNANTVRVFVNHELPATAGTPYTLANGLELRGARISWFDIDKSSRTISESGVAIRRVFDRRGEQVGRAEQINERWGADDQAGFNTLCSAQGYRAGEMGFVDDLMFTHEEVSAEEDHPHGGSIWALDIRNGDMWALPELGRGSWENVTAVATPDYAEADGHVALLLADDLEFGAAPLYLWVGRKIPGGSLPARNGLTEGTLFVWRSDDEFANPEDWHGTGEVAAGSFVPVITRDAKQVALSGHDRDGYLNDVLLREQARRLGAFMFSRPEDLHTNPLNPAQVVFASTGHGKTFPSDDWGTLYRIDLDFADGDLQAPLAVLTILHDGDDFGDYAIRNADNVVWASDGMIYVTEDKATKLRAFGSQTGRELSVWRINPAGAGRVPAGCHHRPRGDVPRRRPRS